MSLDITSTKKEKWKPVVGYEGLYEVSSLGRIKSIARKHIINDKRGFTSQRGVSEKIRISRLNPFTGYIIVELSNKKVKTYSVHRLVARAFIGEPKDIESDVNHINGDKADNRVENLEWCTRSQNMRHAENNGLLRNRGELSTSSKIKKSDVEEIIRLCNQGEISQKEIGNKFNISQAQVSRIFNGRNWRYE